MDTHGDLFAPMQLSTAGRPQFHEDEIELKTTENIRIETDQRKCVIERCTLILTNMRVLVRYEIKSAFVVAFIHLKLVERVEDCASMFRPSKRIRFHYIDGRKLEFKFLSSGKEKNLNFVDKCLQRKAWVAAEEADARKKAQTYEGGSQTNSFSARSAGVSGLIRRQEQEHQTMDTLTKAALTDLDALMSHAKDVVGIIEKYAAVRFNKSDDQSETSSEIGTLLPSIILNHAR